MIRRSIGVLITNENDLTIISGTLMLPDKKNPGAQRAS